MIMSKKKITLISSDREAFEVDEGVVCHQSQTIKNLIEDTVPESGIPLPNINSRILAMVIEYCRKHANESSNEDVAATDELKNWDDKFVKVDRNTLFEFILAANYLNIKGLLDLTCQTVADMMKGMSVEEVRELFNIDNDFTPEEEEAVRKENQWAFE